MTEPRYDDQPTESNKRKTCLDTVNKCVKDDPWFGFEQKYCLLGMDERPFGWPVMGYPSPQGPHYCGVGTHFVFRRQGAQAHLRANLYAGIKIYGTNGERMASQWKYQVGPADGISVADDLIMSRFLLHRLSEEFGALIHAKCQFEFREVLPTLVQDSLRIDDPAPTVIRKRLWKLC